MVPLTWPNTKSNQYYEFHPLKSHVMVLPHNPQELCLCWSFQQMVPDQLPLRCNLMTITAIKFFVCCHGDFSNLQNSSDISLLQFNLHYRSSLNIYICIIYVSICMWVCVFTLRLWNVNKSRHLCLIHAACFYLGSFID